MKKYLSEYKYILILFTHAYNTMSWCPFIRTIMKYDLKYLHFDQDLKYLHDIT